MEWLGVGQAALLDAGSVAGDMGLLFSPGYSLACIFGDGALGMSYVIGFIR